MSKAFKCDRCGRFYEGYFIDPEENYVITTKLDASKSKFIDLCPICQDSFSAWIKEYCEIDKEDAE